MAIFLTILKIIGIVLLVILGLILLIILLVLFMPISYKLTAVHNEKETVLKAKVNYLIVRVLASFEKGVGLDFWVKLLFFTIMSKDGKGKKEDKPESEEDMLTADFGDLYEDDETVDLTPDFQSDNISENNGTGGQSDQPQITGSVTDAAAGEVTTEASPTGDTSSGDTSAEETPAEEKIKTPLPEKIDKALDKFEETLDNVDEKYQKALVKIDHGMQFLDRDYVQKTINRVFKIVKRLFGTIKPKKSRGYVKMGLGSAGDTGMILGKIAAFYPLYGRWLTIEPDFYNKVIEADIDIRGRIYLFRIVLPAIGMVLTPSFWKTIKLAKKI